MNTRIEYLLKQSYNAIFNSLIVSSLSVFGVLGYTQLAHAELTVAEKDPQSSIVNQYEQLKASNVTLESQELHDLIDQLNERIEENPDDALAWEMLARIYHEYGYIDYALFAASEAIDLGSKDDELYSILLKGSTSIADSQLELRYADDINDEDFIRQYQSHLSKVYGSMYGFNYDESLPKPPVPTRTRNSRSASNNTTTRRTTRSTTRATSTRSTTRRVNTPKKTSPPKKITQPASKPKPTTPSTQRPSDDPFKILR